MIGAKTFDNYRYKYVILSKLNNAVMWETGPNRVVQSPYGQWPSNFSVFLNVDGPFRV